MCTSTWRGNWLQGKWPDLALMLLFTSQSESNRLLLYLLPKFGHDSHRDEGLKME